MSFRLGILFAFAMITTAQAMLHGTPASLRYGHVGQIISLRQVKDGTNKAIIGACSATMLATDIAITAAHCLYNASHGVLNPDELTFRTVNPTVRNISVKAVAIVSDFKVSADTLSRLKTGGDIALVQLEDNLGTKPEGAKILLARQAPRMWSVLTAVSTEGCGASKELSELHPSFRSDNLAYIAHRPVTAKFRVRQSFLFSSSDSYLWLQNAQSPKAVTCPGDSGSPIFGETPEGDLIIFGVSSMWVSRADLFGALFGGSYEELHAGAYYTSVSHYHDWIMKKISEFRDRPNALKK